MFLGYSDLLNALDTGATFQFDIREAMKKGHTFKDAICPDTLEFKKDHFIMGHKYGRVLFLKEFASYIKDSMLMELTGLNRPLIEGLGGSAMVPFEDQFPKDTQLYRMMTTKPSDLTT